MKYDPRYVRRLFEVKEGHILVAAFSSKISQVVKSIFSFRSQLPSFTFIN